MSLGHLNAIPVGVHMYQIAARLYLPQLKKQKGLTEKNYNQIGDHFRELYGSLAGWAHTVSFQICSLCSLIFHSYINVSNCVLFSYTSCILGLILCRPQKISGGRQTALIKKTKRMKHTTLFMFVTVTLSSSQLHY